MISGWLFGIVGRTLQWVGALWFVVIIAGGGNPLTAIVGCAMCIFGGSFLRYVSRHTTRLSR